MNAYIDPSRTRYLATYLDMGVLGDEVEVQVQYQLAVCDGEPVPVVLRVIAKGTVAYGKDIYGDLPEHTCTDLIELIEKKEGLPV